MKDIIARLEAVAGNASFFYKSLEGQPETAAFNEDFAHVAASIIKVPIMVECFRRFDQGSAKKTDTLTLRDEYRVPPCGVLTFMHQGLEVTLMDLIWLMITISDNVATNMLIDYLGIDAIEDTIRACGLRQTTLGRKLFDRSPGAKGKSNYISAADCGLLLEKMYLGQLISPQASKEMLDVLKGQQLNNKIPFLLPLDYTVAHKTGEDGSITHDVGIVYAKRPFIVCFCGSRVDAPAFNRLMAEVTLELTSRNGGVVED